MKKLLTVLFLLLFVTFTTLKVQAISFDEAINQKKPSVVLIYADWIDNLKSVESHYSTLEQQNSGQYSFVKINIGKDEAKNFNKKNYIFPNLPYVMLFKDRGRVSRYIKQDCLMNEACIKEKMDFFAD